MMNLSRLKNWKKIPYVSIGLVVINVILFLIEEFGPVELFQAGALNVEDVLIKGEYERFIYCMFLHADIEHLFNNMVMLYFMGTMIEKEIGHLSYGIIYFISGIGGGLLSLYVKLVQGNPFGSVGASGAIFGLDGLLLAMVLFYRKPMPMVTPLRVCLMIILSLYGGMTAGNVDNAAHIGGLLVGLITGALFCMIRRHSKGLPLPKPRDDDEEN